MRIVRLCGLALISSVFALAAASAPALALDSFRNKLADILITGYAHDSDLPTPPPKFAGTPGAPQAQVSPGPPNLATPDSSLGQGHLPRSSADHAWGSHQFVLGGSMRAAKTPSLKAK